MKIFATNQGIAREAADGTLEILKLDASDLGAILEEDPELQSVGDAAVRKRVALEDVELRAPLARPGKIICIGINYASHVEEMRPVLERMGGEVPTNPVFFLVPGSAVCGQTNRSYFPTSPTIRSTTRSSSLWSSDVEGVASPKRTRFATWLATRLPTMFPLGTSR